MTLPPQAGTASDPEVVFFFEGVARELDVICALQALLTQRHGLDSAVINVSAPQALPAAGYRPRVVVTPYFYTVNSIHNGYLLGWRQARYLSLNWEQLLYAGNKQAKSPRGVIPTRHCEHLSWGADYTRLLEQQGVPAARVHQLGNPALWLYREPYRAALPSRTDLARTSGLDPARRWLLFPENYNWAFYDQSILDGFRRAGTRQEDLDAQVKYATESLAEVLRWLAELAKDDGLQIIVRPRPSTETAALRAFGEKVFGGTWPERLALTKEGPVRDWIAACDLVVSSYSTTMIEAGIAGKSVAMLLPAPLPPSLRMAWHDFLPGIRSLDELRQFSAPGAKPAPLPELRQWADANLLGPRDAIRALADVIGGLAQAPPPEPLPARELLLPGLMRSLLPAPLCLAWRRHRCQRAARRQTVEPLVGITRSEYDAKLAAWRRLLAANPRTEALS